MKYIEELKKKKLAQDVKYDELIKKSPLGYHDKEFEELILLKAELKGAETALALRDRQILEMIEKFIERYREMQNKHKKNSIKWSRIKVIIDDLEAAIKREFSLILKEKP